MKILYTAVATARGGRDGRTTSSDGKLDLALSIPQDLGGPGGEGTNPEQLFALGYAACFDNALIMAARRLKMEVNDPTVTAHVGMGAIGNGGLGLAVELHLTLPGLSREEAEKLAETAHKVCPYSNATRGNIEVQIIIEEPAA